MRSKIIKLIRYACIGYPLLALSFLIPRKKDKWLIGAQNRFICNSKYFFLKHHDQHEGKLIWISPSKTTHAHLKRLGLPCAYKYSFSGLYHLLTAKVYITSYGTQYDLSFWTKGNALVVYLWHGVGIKNLNYASTSPTLRTIYHTKNLIKKAIYAPYREKPALFLTTSTLMTQHFMKCFNLTVDRIYEGGYPRCELLQASEAELMTHVRKYETSSMLETITYFKDFEKIFLYMPTWRDQNPDFLTNLQWDFEKLNAILQEKQQLFVLKLHPMSTTKALEQASFTNILILPSDLDIYPLLPFTDVLITDYSSIYYDYILMDGKDVILFPYDIQDYIQKSRDLAFDYSSHTYGHTVYDFHNLIETVKHELYHNDRQKQEKIKQLFWGNNSHNDIYTKINEMVHHEHN